MRARPYAFLQVGNRWINFALVTDVEDNGDSLTIFMASEMARMVGKDDPKPIDVARRLVVSDPKQVHDIRLWLKMSDEN